MQFRGLLVALVAAMVVAGLIVWSNKAKEEEAKKPPKDEAAKLLTIPEADIAQIDIDRRGGEHTTLKRTAEGWEITSPQPFKADKEAANSLATAFTSLASDKLVEEKPASLTEFGLTEPTLTVTVTKKDGKTTKLLVGDETPTASGSFAKTEGDGRVFTLASFTKTTIDKAAKDLRDKRLLLFDSEKLARVELNAKGTATEFGKNNQGEWSIVKPKPYRADNLQVEELVRKLKDAKLDAEISAADAKKAVAEFGGASLVGRATVTDNAGAQTLEVRKTKDAKYYAKSTAVAGIHSITAEIGEGLDKATDDFRNKKVFDFGFSDPTKVDYTDGAKTLALTKSGEKWMAGGKAMDPVSVQSFIDRLRDLAATKFIDGTLPNPTIRLTVVSNEGKRTEKIALAKQGDAWLAQRENEPALYDLGGTVVDELQKAAGDVKEPPPPTKDEKKDAKK